MTGSTRALMRAFSLLAVFPCYLLLHLLQVRLYGHSLDRSLQHRRRFASWLIKFLGIRCDQRGGAPQQGPFLYVSNHRSYLDALLIHQEAPVLPIAKAEVGRWPLIGLGIRQTGVLLVSRENKNSRTQTRTAVLDALRQGLSVLVFPEGTTHTASRTIDFRPGTFLIAAEHRIPVVPVAVEYPDPQVAFVGNDAFLPHFMRIFRKHSVHAQIRFGPPLCAESAADLTAMARTWIDGQLLEMQAELGLFRS